MKLITEPDDGPAPILSAIKNAKESIEVTFFRFDRRDVEEALKSAVARGVKVTALIAYANRGGEKQLRELEMRFLEVGIIVARTADDLVRYHDKLMIIDRRLLCVLSFNFTHLDIAHSRSFGVLTRNAKLVQEAVKLFEADCTRKEYAAGLPALIVSPANSRAQLGAFIKGARKQLLIYDPEISDEEMIQMLEQRAKSGVEIRIIGHVDEHESLPAAKLSQLRLHTRTIIRDREQAFVGSQSLRAVELDKRREVGLIVRESKVVKALIDTFERDWNGTDSVRSKKPARDPEVEISKKEADKVARALIKELHPVAVTVKRAVRKVVANAGDEALRDEKVKDTVKKIVKKAVKTAVREATQDAKSV